MCTAQYHTNAIVVSDFTIASNKEVGKSIINLKSHTQKLICYACYLAEGRLARHACALPLR